MIVFELQVAVPQWYKAEGCFGGRDSSRLAPSHWGAFSVYRSSDSGISSGSTRIVGKMRGTPSEIQPWAVRLKVGRLAVGSCSSGYLGGFRSISGTLKVIPRGAFSNPPYGVATLTTEHSDLKSNVLFSFDCFPHI